MYQNPIPILAVSPEDFARLRTGQRIEIHETGLLEIQDEGES
jgi:predicted aconitase with swiveling domain